MFMAGFYEAVYQGLAHDVREDEGANFWICGADLMESRFKTGRRDAKEGAPLEGGSGLLRPAASS